MHWVFLHRKQILLAIAALLLLALFPHFRYLSVEDLVDFTPASPILAALLLVCLYCLKSVVMVIPVTVFYITAGILFSPLWAVAVTYLGILCEAALGYLLGRRMGRDRAEELIQHSEKAARFFAYQSEHSATTCFVARILPFPFDLVSLFFGAADMPLPRYLTYSLLGLTPGMIPWVLAGNAMERPLSIEFLIPFGISIVITATVFFLHQRIQKKTRPEG